MKKLQSLIETYQRFVLTTHLNPDGDALGSQHALAALIRSRRKAVRIINCDSTPQNYLFLDPDGSIEVFQPARHMPVLMDAEVIFLIDTNDPRRLRSMGDAVLKSSALRVIIDHHPEPVDFGASPIVDTDATATGELIYMLIRQTDPGIMTSDVSTALYTAIMTDTGSFRFPKTDPEIHRITADLIQHGADPADIYAHVYENGPINRLRLLGQMLSRLTTTADGAVGYAVITRKMFSETQTSEIDTDGFINYTLGIGGVRIGLLFVEQPDEVKISFRSKGNIPVNELAKEF
ncbi:MAG TPA: bifunctional oligoribonuclease/PAP phosphatase NrnA, partial [bacterium]